MFSFLNYVIFIPTSAYAGEEISTIKKGEAAPFDGTLFSTSAAARILVELESAKESCKIECDKAVEEKSAELQLKYDMLLASKTALQYKYDETLIIKNDQIDFLQNQVKKPKISHELSFALGILAGVGLTMGSAYALSQIPTR
tara:strand:- start:50 stop:478 length:429 start_codon:yes stop_codon:yes gene_type:complete